MSVDILGETMTLSEAAALLPKSNGKAPSASTVWRWCKVGIGGVRLDYTRRGRVILTSREALRKFSRALSEADRPAEPVTAKSEPESA